MHYKYLSEIGNHYSSEEGTSGVRQSALRGLETPLKQAIIDLANIEKGTPVAAPAGSSVRALIRFHKEQHQDNKDARIADARAKVKRLTKWLKLQGAAVDTDGNIEWTKSNRQVVYDRDATTRAMTMLRFAGGIIFTDDAHSNRLDTSKMVTYFSGPGKAIYVMSEQGNIHVSSHSVGHRHHSSLLAGANTSGAGELEVKNGKLVWLSNKSGHYTPDIAHLLQTLHQLQKKNVDMSFRLAVLSAAGKKEYNTVGDFLHALDLDDEPDYELMKLMAYVHHLVPPVLQPHGWRWGGDATLEKAGVYQIADSQPVPHKDVRQWLKANNYLANTAVKSGAGR